MMPGWHACGCVMDYLRSCYASNQRPFRDRPDVIVRGRWHWSPPGARVIPYEHLFGSSTHDPNGTLDDPPLGELRGHHGRSKGKTSARYTGQNWCGSEEVWTQGALFSALGTPTVDEEGVPKCCQSLPPTPGGADAAGDASYIGPGSVLGLSLIGGGVIEPPVLAGGGVQLGGEAPSPDGLVGGGVLVGGGNECQMACASTPPGLIASSVWIHLVGEDIPVSDGDPFGTWPDSGPNGFDQMQADGSVQPVKREAVVNGLAAAEFAANAWMASPQNWPSTCTVYAVLKLTAVGPGAILGAQDGGLEWEVTSTPSQRVFVVGVEDTGEGIHTLALDTWVILSFVRSSSSTLCRVETCVDLGHSHADLPASNNSFLGAKFESGTGDMINRLSAQLAELFICDETHSGEDMQANVCFLRSKYDL